MKTVSLLATLLCVFAATPRNALSCCALGRPGEPVVNADQTVLLIWDPATKTEHFIRKASFKTEGDDFGFLVPTPSRPQLSESGGEAFATLAEITRPVVRSGGFSLGCSTLAPMSAAKEAVRVIERKEVAGFDAAVLSASSATALTGWLKQNGYQFSPESEAWAEPYVRDGWMMTALRVLAQEKGVVQAAALRISFNTERPLFPYREPDSRQAAKTVGSSSRLLRMYLISDARYDGALDGAHNWSGKPVWSGSLDADQKAKLLTTLKLPASSGPTSWWLTEFEDRWAYGIAPGDLYFSRSGNQAPLARPAIITPGTRIDLFFPLCALALIVLVIRIVRGGNARSTSTTAPAPEKPFAY